MDNKKIEQAMKQAEVSIMLDDKPILEEYKKLVRERLTNQISEQEFQRRVRELI